MADPEFQDHVVANQVIYDKTGNAVGVVLDGSVYRLQGENLIVGKTAGAGANKEVSVIDDTEDSSTKRLQTESRFALNQTITVTTIAVPSDPSNFVSGELEDGGGSNAMNVDGSGVAVEFQFDADATQDILLSELRLVMASEEIDFNGASFAKGSTLTNGVKISVQSNSGGDVQIFLLKTNEDFLRLISPAGVFYDASNDVVVAVGLNFGTNIRLVGGSSDYVRITIQDDLTSGGSREVDYFKAVQWGVKL